MTESDTALNSGAEVSFVDAVAVADLPPDSQKTVCIGSTRVLLCNSAGKLFALEDKCSHAFQPLADGEVTDGAITCSKHGACFRLTDGEPLNDVAKRPVKIFDVRVRDNRIEVGSSPRVR
jgi:3-phenylpropionate/trans-cinnamate dioxygenase ferredoxin component